MAPAEPAGGVIRGTVKSGTVPLPGVGVTATNTLTGKKYATTTDVTGAFAMAVPRNGRYVVKAELAAFASVTQEALINAQGQNGGKAEQVVDLGMQLASRVEQTAADSNYCKCRTNGRSDTCWTPRRRDGRRTRWSSGGKCGECDGTRSADAEPGGRYGPDRCGDGRTE